MTSEGRIKVFNYTIIESLSFYNKYVREIFGLKGKFDNKTESDIS